MIKDIEHPEVKQVYVAAVDLALPGLEPDWAIFLINDTTKALKDVLVSSRGYGELNGEPVKTSTLRQYFEVLEPQDKVQIEPIQPEVFGLNNEYWVSFYVDGMLYDKKFIFLPETIHDQNLTLVPVMEQQGILLG
jgi:hypothetical protein